MVVLAIKHSVKPFFVNFVKIDNLVARYEYQESRWDCQVTIFLKLRNERFECI